MPERVTGLGVVELQRFTAFSRRGGLVGLVPFGLELVLAVAR